MYLSTTHHIPLALEIRIVGGMGRGPVMLSGVLENVIEDGEATMQQAQVNRILDQFLSQSLNRIEGNEAMWNIFLNAGSINLIS